MSSKAARVAIHSTIFGTGRPKIQNGAPCLSSARLESTKAGPSNRPQPRRLAALHVPEITARMHKAKAARLSEKKPERVAFVVGDGGISNECREFFSKDSEAEAGFAEGIEDDLVGLEPGRVVECRRSGGVTLGLILTHLIVGGRPRLLLLRPNGEIWPISPRDVQFVMQSSLISTDLASKCWSSELLENRSAGKPDLEGLDSEVMETILNARREAVMIMRKVNLHTEKMEQKLVSGGIDKGMIGGVEVIWDRWSSTHNGERIGITSVEAAEYLINSGETKTTVRPNNLPAYAAHRLMMQRSDLFLADQGEMWETGQFMVRSRAERERLENVSRWVEGRTEKDKAPLKEFVGKARIVIEATRTGAKVDLPEWSSTDLDIISILTTRLFELRSTQVSPYHQLVPSIVKALGLYPDQRIEEGSIDKLLREIGVSPPWDSLEVAKSVETDRRNISLTNTVIKNGTDMLAGNELDHLREDFTSHTVYVIDDPTASELDDGISLERIHNSTDIWVHVHVADPTRYLSFNHPLSIKASFQGSSLYLPEGGRPLFPDDVIMTELSLGAKISRDDGAQGVMTFSARLSETGDALDSKVAMGWIKKPRVVTYESVDLALGIERSRPVRPLGSIKTSPNVKEQSEISKTDIVDLEILRSVAIKHRAKRFQTSGLEWSIPSGEISMISGQGPLINLFDRMSLSSTPRISTSTPELDYTISSQPSNSNINAALIVQEMMIIAGKVAGSFCKNHSIPVIYRGSSAPTLLPSSKSNLTIDNLLASRVPGTGIIDPFSLITSDFYLSPGLTDIKPLNHWSMGIEPSQGGYVRVTSPLRRFGDMVAHWQIKSVLSGLKGSENAVKALDGNEVLALAKRSEGGMKRTRRAQKNVQAYWRAGLFMSRMAETNVNGLGEEGIVDLNGTLKARIAGSTTYLQATHSSIVPVHLTDLACMADLAFGGIGSGKFKFGDEVQVKIEGICQWPVSEITVKLA